MKLPQNAVRQNTTAPNFEITKIFIKVSQKCTSKVKIWKISSKRFFNKKKLSLK